MATNRKKLVLYVYNIVVVVVISIIVIIMCCEKHHTRQNKRRYILVLHGFDILPSGWNIEMACVGDLQIFLWKLHGSVYEEVYFLYYHGPRTPFPWFGKGSCHIKLHTNFDGGPSAVNVSF